MKHSEQNAQALFCQFPQPTIATDRINLSRQWRTGPCPVCRYPKADIDQEEILWCPACGYSKKGCYT